MFSPDLIDLAEQTLAACRRRKFKITTAESCTGGLIAALLTEIVGSSDVVDRAYVTYSNRAKSEMIGVPPMLIEAHGAVSAPVAQAMAEGALIASGADLAVAVTGIAGPGGGTPTKQVGLVHFALAGQNQPTLHVEQRFGDRGRTLVRLAAVEVALGLLIDRSRAHL
jgi:nicotinamide-nucleotide amidase